MSKLDSLKKATGRSDVAKILGYKPSALAYILYQMPDAEKYQAFQIQKRAGGHRQIFAPTPKLKTLQSRLASALYACLAEMESHRPERPISNAFLPGRSIVTNATSHRRRRYILNIDLSDFFPSINFGRVRGYFIHNHEFRLSPDVATVIAQIACRDGSLPQGSPCSPIISEFIGRILDIRLARLAKKNGARYSRYADDLTFSTNKKEFPAALAVPASADHSTWEISNPLRSTIENSGFVVNDEKTRLHTRLGRQVVSGLTVNSKVNVRSEYYRYARAMCHTLFKTGTYTIPASIGSVGDDGSLPSSYTTGTDDPRKLIGIVEHIHYVKDLSDDRRWKDKIKEPTATHKLYNDLLFYSGFLSAPMPLVVCEGKTDNVYIRCAAKRLAAQFPGLASTANGEHKLLFNLFRYGSRFSDLSGVTGGSGPLKGLFLYYKKRASYFEGASLNAPVVILIDNDSAVKDLKKLINELFGVSVSNSDKNSYYHMHKNLYLIKTPHLGTKKESFIEEMFDSATLNMTFNDKRFDPDKEHGDHSSYGKAIFANEIVRKHQDSIDFSGFAPLLERIWLAIQDYYDR